MNPVYAASPRSTYHGPERRQQYSPAFILIELDPREVIDGEIIEGQYMTPDTDAAGYMREHCPYCPESSLQLLLKYRHVRRTHLFCAHCTRCFDALHPDGSSALATAALML
ncbi:hypothetical protein [Undibacterium squillarum]|uniref:LIM zinc-binding domain-containing protein n=1 Tax=Undibacterium squillarum TaxID=1131567 RepID=A0ABQ2Y1P9_9BURK|nr:hypothetical protein [Undibacterium squillarum]GGX50782.1 hypothetical protein GCM10010946_31920 [Undibacterium squillarum]